MEAAMVSRYMDPVELSWTILLALMLEILSVILPTAATSVEVPHSSHAGSGILMQVTMLAKPHARNGLQFSLPGGGVQLICLIF